MPERKSTRKRPRDLNVLAASITKAATEGEEEEVRPEDEGKNPHAVALGRLGGLKGGKARAAKLSKKKRSEIARKAAQARWSKNKNTSQS
jgi:hypothetical protein